MQLSMRCPTPRELYRTTLTNQAELHTNVDWARQTRFVRAKITRGDDMWSFSLELLNGTKKQKSRARLELETPADFDAKVGTHPTHPTHPDPPIQPTNPPTHSLTHSRQVAKARQTMMRIRSFHMAKGWSSWLRFVEDRAWGAGQLNKSIGHLKNRELHSGWAKWVEVWEERRRTIDVLQQCATRMANREIIRCWERWLDVTEELLANGGGR